jgi:hypothetical protein
MRDNIKLVAVCLVLVGLLAVLGVAGQAEAADKAPTIVQMQAVVKAVMPGTFWFNGPCSVVLLSDGTYRATNEHGNSTILDLADPQNPFRFRSRPAPGWGSWTWSCTWTPRGRT